MAKQIVGAILLIVFISFLGNKFYDAVKDAEHASLIMYLMAVILLIVLLAVGKQLKGY